MGRIDAVWLRQSPEIGQRDGQPAEHRNGSSRLEQVVSKGGSLRARLGVLGRLGLSGRVNHTSMDPEGGPESLCMGAEIWT